MTIHSSLPAVVDAVLGMFTTISTGQTDAQLGQVEVVDGEFGTYVADEFLQLVDARLTQVSATMDGSRRDETIEVNCMVRCYQGNDDQQATRSRAAALLALVETAVENDPSLGGATNVRAQMAAGAYRGGATETGGRASEIDFTIAVVTQLINV